MHFIRHIKAFHIVLCLAALFSLNNLFFLALDKSSLCADAGDNFCTSIHYFRLWNRIPNQELFSEFNNINRNRPPLSMIAPIPWYYLFGITPDVALLSNVAFAIILFLSCYFLAKALFNESIGLLATTFLLLYPGVSGFSRIFLDDFPLAALVCLAMLLLIRTNYFLNTGRSVVFGIISGLGMLTKFNYLIFIIGPFLYYAVSSIRKTKKRPIVNIVVAMVLCIFVSSIWYAHNAKQYFLLYFGKHHVGWEVQAARDLIIPVNLLYYLRQLVHTQIYPFFCIVFLLALFLIVLCRRPISENVLLLIVWIIVPLALLSFSPMKAARYSLPYLPAIAIISAYGIDMVSLSRLKKLVIGLSVFLGVFQILFITYGKSAENFFPAVSELRKEVDAGNRVGLLQVFHSKNAAEEILDIIVKDGNKNHKKIFCAPPLGSLQSPLAYEALMRGIPLSVIHGDINTAFPHKEAQASQKSSESLMGALRDSDYLILDNDSFSKLMCSEDIRDALVITQLRNKYSKIGVIKPPEEMYGGRGWVVLCRKKESPLP